MLYYQSQMLHIIEKIYNMEKKGGELLLYYYYIIIIIIRIIAKHILWYLYENIIFNKDCF